MSKSLYRSKTQTPLMRQYWDIKSVHPDKVLFFRMGDFYEMFCEDAVTVAPLLGIALTARNKGVGNQTPMCGVPHHSISKPINTLLSLGYRVAICDQLEDPKTAKGIVKRGVTHIFSPGIVYDSNMLDEHVPHLLTAYTEKVLSFLDVTTGDAFYYELQDKSLRNQILSLLRPVEMILTQEQKQQQSQIDRHWKKNLSLTVHDQISSSVPSTDFVSNDRLLSYLVGMQGRDTLSALKPLKKGFFHIK